MSNEHLTVPEKLLLAALAVRERSATFTAEDLVVEAWKKYPDTFGLSGYGHDYPDSNRVLTNIMGTKGMRGKGWLRKVGEKQYRLTSAGLNDGEGLMSQMSGGAKTKEAQFLRAELDRHAASAISRVIGTGAARKIFLKEEETITFNDACGFWDITVRSNANTLNSRLADVTVLLERVLEATKNLSESEGLKIGGTTITKHKILTLIKLNQDMQNRFKSELDIIAKRTDERAEKKTKIF